MKHVIGPSTTRHLESHPVRVRGLKLLDKCRGILEHKSHPVRVRGLKHIAIADNEWSIASHPVRVRGLKPAELAVRIPVNQSHPVRVRGLKLGAGDQLPANREVAPRAGAWVETLLGP